MTERARPMEGRGRPERRDEGGPRAEREGRWRGRWSQPPDQGFDGVREKDYICVLALKRV